MKTMITTLTAGTVLTLAGHAAAMSLSGNVRMARAPVSVQDGDRTNSRKAVLFAEQTNTTLAGDLTLGAYLPGVYDGSAAAASRTVAAGRTVSSYMLHADVDTDADSPVLMTGSISFNEKILGVIFGRFGASDALLGAPGTTYKSTVGNGLDFTGPNSDMFRISNDRTRIDFSFYVGGIADQVRIITAGAAARQSVENPIPEPVTTTLMAMGLGGLALRRRHIEWPTRLLAFERTASA